MKRARLLRGLADYDNIVENLKIMSDPYLMDVIKQGNVQIDAGRARVHALIDEDD